MNGNLQKKANASLNLKEGALEKILDDAYQSKKSLINQASRLEEILKLSLNCINSGGTLYACGNGGSACDAMHFVEELVARYSLDRPGIKAQHFLDPGTLTCWANDYDFESAYERQVQTFLGENDLLFVFSTSGNSPNILKALSAANKAGAKTIAFLGKGGGKAKELASHSLIIESENTARIQESHIACVHALVERIEGELFGS